MVELAFRLRNGGLTMRTRKVTLLGVGVCGGFFRTWRGWYSVFGIWYLVPRVLAILTLGTEGHEGRISD